MFRCFKPTHLWHLTSKKHFRKMILDRECSRPPHDQRDRKPFVKLLAIVLASTIGMMTSFGLLFAPKPPPVKMVCDTSKSKRKTCKPPKEPCPPKEEKPMKPCKRDE